MTARLVRATIHWDPVAGAEAWEIRKNGKRLTTVHNPNLLQTNRTVSKHTVFEIIDLPNRSEVQEIIIDQVEQ